ncbi:MAG: hypothetical protein OQK32_04080 [Gammaproteobacteria bacterium]|nr:hypothetical protein [Gammaproteobacteria bacterium]MCW8923798.1 hypothetical protein [Gammaproteobacteria bacterium]
MLNKSLHRNFATLRFAKSSELKRYMNKVLNNTIIILLLSFCLMGASTQRDVVELVMEANSRDDLYGTNNPTMDDRRYVWAISEMLIEIVLKDPDNDRAWAALHRFRDFTDAGITTIYNDACFKAIKDKPLIFYKRYMAGDELALERAVGAVWGTDSYEGDRSESIKSNIAVLKRSAQLISELNSSNKRHRIFIDSYESAINKMIEEVSHITSGSS